MSSKRKRATTPDSKTNVSVKQVKQDGQRAVSKDLHIPLDDGVVRQLGNNGKVYIDDEGVIFDASLTQSNVSHNNNKFYRVQLVVNSCHDDPEYFTYIRWGRLGEFGQDKLLAASDLPSAIKDFGKKFRDKTGLAWSSRDDEPKTSKYTFIQKNYEDDDDDNDDDDKAQERKAVKKEEENEEENEEEKPTAVESKLPIQTQRLMELIFNENHFNSVLENIGYNQDKLPLGKLGKSTILKGFEHLKELASLIKHPKLAQNKYQISQTAAIEQFTNKYYSTIPHVFGRFRPRMIDNNDVLQREVAMLDTLSDMEVASAIMKTTNSKARDADSVNLIDQRFAQLNCDVLTPLPHYSPEYHALQRYLISTAGHTHNIRFRLQDIFRVKRAGEEDRFQASPYAKRQDTCRRLLWHGSRTTNFGGILSQGLRIAPPEAPVNGYAFGKGVYLADISTKSANYCMASLSGGHGLLLLCEAELGNPMYELLSGDSGAEEQCKKAGSIATMGVGRTINQGWVDAGIVHESLKGVLIPDTTMEPADQTLHPSAYLQYNEYICYDVAQIRLRYLLRFTH